MGIVTKWYVATGLAIKELYYLYLTNPPAVQIGSLHQNNRGHLSSLRFKPSYLRFLCLLNTDFNLTEWVSALTETKPAPSQC